MEEGSEEGAPSRLVACPWGASTQGLGADDGEMMGVLEGSAVFVPSLSQQGYVSLPREPGAVLAPEHTHDVGRKALALPESLACGFPPWLRVEITWGL